MEFRKQKGIYLQIADYICENVLTEQWKAGEKILSVREMAASIEVNPNTVARTYSYLQDQGIIFMQRGIGYFVADDALPRTQVLKKDDFVNEFLPEVFHTMDVLGIKIEDLLDYYQHRDNGQTDKE
ncbi:MAG: GntR family transcriptional regulator [Bacteroidia bacterium]|nr:GntR family transcriptional regulator [Bacteroidia bacterium]